jgi:hypothetical protein
MIEEQVTPAGSDEMKQDGGKPPLELIPWEAVIACDDAVIDESRTAASYVHEYLAGGGPSCLTSAGLALLNDLAEYVSDGKTKCTRADWPVLIEVAHVLAFGARKYGRDKWREGKTLTQTRVLGATLRHIAADDMGEERDAETNRYHLAHALCEVFFAISFALDGRQDDRPRRPEVSRIDLTEAPETDLDLAELNREAEETSQLVHPKIPPSSKAPEIWIEEADGFWSPPHGEWKAKLVTDVDLEITLPDSTMGYYWQNPEWCLSYAVRGRVDPPEAAALHAYLISLRSAETSSEP